MGRPAVFLDRDGVLTIPEFRDGRSYAPTSLENFQLYADAAPSVARLKEQGYLVIVATNQPDVTTGKLDGQTLETMHHILRAETRVDDIEVSFATRDAPDRRRKPEPGMLIDAAQKWDIDLTTSYMVGDRASDVRCGVQAGCRAVFIDLGYTAEETPRGQDATFANLSQAVDWICTNSTGAGRTGKGETP